MELILENNMTQMEWTTLHQYIHVTKICFEQVLLLGYDLSMQSDSRDQFVRSCDWSGWFYNILWHGMNYTHVGAWLHILFIALGVAQMDRCQFFALPSPPQPPPMRLDLTKSHCNFGLECIGRLFVLHKRVWQHSFAQTVIYNHWLVKG